MTGGLIMTTLAKRTASIMIVLIMLVSLIPSAVMAAGYNGWLDVDGVWYYFKNGDAVKGWQKIGGKWYFFYEEYGEMMDYPSYNIAGTTYVFNSKGQLVDNQTGWFKTSWGGYDLKFYVKKGGVATTGWKQISKKWYFFDSKGVLLEPDSLYCKDHYDPYKIDNGIYEVYVSGSYYCFKKDGSMVANSWVSIFNGGSWYYLDKNGKLVTGWKQIDKKWYYFDPDNGSKMVSDYWIDYPEGSHNWYYFDKSGAMVTNRWVEDEGYWYYQGKDGKSVKGWLKLGKNWYYLAGDDGTCITDQSYVVNGKTYKFDKNGVCLNP